LDAIKA